MRGLRRTVGWVRSRRAWVGALGSCLLALVLSVWAFDPKLGVHGDDAEFVMLARSLAAGRGLTYLNDPDLPVGSRYPPGFPAMLAPLAAELEATAPGPLTGAGSHAVVLPGQGVDWVAMKWLVAGTYCLAMGLLFVFANRELGLAGAAIVVLLAATNPVVVEFSHVTMSEVPYMAASVLAIVLVTRAVRAERANPLAVAAAVLALGAAYYVRTVGAMLVLAAAVSVLALGRWRLAAALAVGASLVVVPWSLYSQAQGGGGSYLEQLVLRNPYQPEMGILTPAGFLERLGANSVIYLGLLVPEVFTASLGPAASPANPASVLFVAVVGVSVALAVWRGRQVFLTLYLVAYLLTLMMWPWPDRRFLIPVVPVLAFLGVWCARQAVEALRGRPVRSAALVLTAALSLGLLAGNAVALRGVVERSRGGYPAAWANYHAAADWIRENTAPEALICCRKPYEMYVISHRRAVCYPFKEPAKVMDFMRRKGVDYIVDEELGFPQTPRFLWPAIRQHRDHFEPLWYRDGPSTYVLRLLSEAEIAAASDSLRPGTEIAP